MRIDHFKPLNIWSLIIQTSQNWTFVITHARAGLVCLFIIYKEGFYWVNGVYEIYLRGMKYSLLNPSVSNRSFQIFGHAPGNCLFINHWYINWKPFLYIHQIWLPRQCFAILEKQIKAQKGMILDKLVLLAIKF